MIVALLVLLLISVAVNIWLAVLLHELTERSQKHVRLVKTIDALERRRGGS
ncbi:MAG TPA: hypothetical protein VF814_04685 [Casimicrobiaceae bacterium]